MAEYANHESLHEMCTLGDCECRCIVCVNARWRRFRLAQDARFAAYTAERRAMMAATGYSYGRPLP